MNMGRVWPHVRIWSHMGMLAGWLGRPRIIVSRQFAQNLTVEFSLYCNLARTVYTLLGTPIQPLNSSMERGKDEVLRLLKRKQLIKYQPKTYRAYIFCCKTTD